MNPSDAFPAFKELPLGSVRPSGWLLAQLRLQADGLTVHLEEMWDDVGPHSAWMGGTGENWERGPYYLDGLIPLAHVLQDERLIGRARKWVEAILASVRMVFRPLKNEDWWPRMAALKCLAQHHEATSDHRVLDFMARYFRHQRDSLPIRPLGDWGQARSAENAFAVLWLHERTGEGWLLELVDLLFSQGLDWETYLRRDLIREPATHFDHFTYVVNVAMALKLPRCGRSAVLRLGNSTSSVIRSQTCTTGWQRECFPATNGLWAWNHSTGSSCAP
jgi:hypothetical protein